MTVKLWWPNSHGGQDNFSTFDSYQQAREWATSNKVAGWRVFFEGDTSRLAQFDTAIQKVTQERAAVYAPPGIDFARANKIKEALGECRDPLARFALEMIAVKMARLIETPGHLDSWIDIAGYARCGVMVTEKPTQS